MSEEIYNKITVKSCSNCGSVNYDGPNEVTLWPDPPDWRIRCNVCKYTCDGFSEEQVITEWNTPIKETAIETSRRVNFKEYYLEKNNV